jgi:hypothetical protein
MIKKFDFFTRKFAYLWLRAVEKFVNLIVYCYSVLFKKKKKSEIKKIAAFWYNPPDIIGSDLRMGYWKKYFVEDGFIYDNFYLNSIKEITKNIDQGTWTSRYFYFSKCLLRRLPQVLKAHKYDCIWIDRGIIPLYPRKKAFIENRLKRVVSKLVVDTTDGGDFEANPELMEDTLKQADEVTVGYKYLKEFYSDRFKVTQIFWTIPTENYIIKEDYNISDVPVIGWMGSPANFEHVLKILPQLQALRKEKNFIFRYVCRKNFNKELVGLDCEHYYFGDDYYKIIAGFDIGISPFLEVNLRTKGKISMKHQEFLLMGIPQVCSDVSISEFVVENEHVLIAKAQEEWKEKLFKLMDDYYLRITLGTNSKILFQNYYLYEKQYENLKIILLHL